MHLSSSVVPTILQLNGTNEKILVTRPAPPIPQSKPVESSPTLIHEDLLLIDFSASSPPKSSSIDALFSDLFVNPSAPTKKPDEVQLKQLKTTTTNETVTTPSEFVAKVVQGVTEQLKNDFPRFDSSRKDYTPPLIRRFTIPYPSQSSSTSAAYQNVYR